jgi:hypothetical protein
MARMTLANAAQVAIAPASKTHDETRNGDDVGRSQKIRTCDLH